MRTQNKIESKYNKEELKKLIEESESVQQLMLKLGYTSRAGSSRTTLSKTSEKYGLSDDLKKLRKKSNLLSREKIKTPFKDIFKENSNYNNNTNLKKRILENNLLKYECEICKNTGEWNDFPMVLQLDHKNGIYNDNRIENLRFLCPNCHSQTDNFSGKNNNKCQYAVRVAENTENV